MFGTAQVQQQFASSRERRQEHHERRENTGKQDDGPNVKHLNQMHQEDAQSLEAGVVVGWSGGLRRPYSR